jgi:hypothetical protein
MGMDKRVFIAAIVTQLIIFAMLAGLQNIKMVNANPLSSGTPVPAPPVPEYSLKYVDNSYKQAENFIQNKSVEVTIKSQTHFYVLCYNLRSKSHLSENWTSYEYYNNSTYLTPQLFIPNRLYAWDNAVTVLAFGFEGNNGSDTYNLILGEVNSGDKIDFQVQGYVGYWFPGRMVNATASIDYYLFSVYAIGDWSPTQTITIPASNPSSPISTPNPTKIPSESPTLIHTESPTLSPSLSPSPSATPSPTIEHNQTPNSTQENSAPILIIVGLLIAAVVVGLLVILVKRRGKK